jgi:hypothetical protein
MDAMNLTPNSNRCQPRACALRDHITLNRRVTALILQAEKGGNNRQVDRLLRFKVFINRRFLNGRGE